MQLANIVNLSQYLEAARKAEARATQLKQT
jgi:hypothetical protein